MSTRFTNYTITEEHIDGIETYTDYVLNGIYMDDTGKMITVPFFAAGTKDATIDMYEKITGVVYVE